MTWVTLFVTAFICLCLLSRHNCHFFSIKFIKGLIPEERISHAVIASTEAASIINCNLKCVNKKPCISTLFTIHQKKCVLLESFFQNIEEFGETTEKDESAKVVETRLVDPCSLVTCPVGKECVNDERLGTICQYAGFNCRELKEQSKNLPSGNYDVWADSSKKRRITVYCDMETQGGGWTQVLKVESHTNDMSQFLKIPFRRWTKLAGFVAEGNYVIKSSALKNSRLVGNDPQFRVKCKLPRANKSLHLQTHKNVQGRAAAKWLASKTPERPQACYSYEILPDDDSHIAKNCWKWANSIDKWGRWDAESTENPFLSGLMWVKSAWFWNLFQKRSQPNRFECDNYRSQVIENGDIWQIFVR